MSTSSSAKDYYTQHMPLLHTDTIFRNLYAITKAGLSMAPGCRKLAENSSPDLSRVWTNLAEQLEAGHSLANALRGSRFSVADWMLEMVSAGETSGTTQRILKCLAEETEARHRWKRSLLMRMLYPAVLLHLTAILPAIPLALSHGGMLALTWFGGFALVIYLPLLGIVLLKRTARHNPRIQLKIESLLLRVPIWGRAIQATRSARFYQTLAALARASSRWEDAMATAASASDSPQLQQRSLQYQTAFREGGDLTGTLREFEYFRSQDLDTLSTGEITGTMHETLEQLATASREIATQQLQLFSVALTVAAYALCIGGILLALLSVMGPVYYQIYELLTY